MSDSDIIEKTVSKIRVDIIELRKEFHEANDLLERIKIKGAIKYAESLIEELQENHNEKRTL